MDIKSYLTGFTDGEGCFSISFSLRKKLKLGIEVRPSFSISQHKRNKQIILQLPKLFGCGGVRFSKKDQNYKYEVRSIGDLIRRIIPHFEQYPLLTSKKEDFEIFKQICKLISSNHHLSKQGLKQVIELSQLINISGSKRINRKSLLKIVDKMNV